VKTEVQAWKSAGPDLPDAWVAVSYGFRGNTAVTEEAPGGGWLAIGTGQGPDAKLIAKNPLPLKGCGNGDFPIAPDPDADGEPPVSCDSLKLDLAPYRLNPRETALGMRVTRTEEFPAGANQTEELVLFRRTGATLSPVLYVVTDENDIQRNLNDQTRAKATVVMDRRQTGGMADILVRETRRIDPAVDDLPASSPPGTRTLTTRYRWDGKQYTKVEEPSPKAKKLKRGK
jgi:hypothetical protein